MTLPSLSAAARASGDEHVELNRLLDHFRSTLNKQQASAQEVSAELSALTQSVLLHFRHEEAGGMFAAATNVAPWLCERASQLLCEHQELATQLALLQEQSTKCAQHDGCSRSLEELFQQFCSAFSTHEAAENALIRAVYCDDVGTGD